ncbi:MAG: hypothetical protein RID93_31530, partial [Sandaracinaceae bacterium]
MQHLNQSKRALFSLILASMAFGCAADLESAADEAFMDIPSASSASELATEATAVADLGVLPEEVSALRWAEAPRISREVTVRSRAELLRETSVSGSRVRVEGDLGAGALQLRADDVEVIAPRTSHLGALTVGRGVKRVRVVGGVWSSIEIEPPATWSPRFEARAEWLAEDIWFSHVTVDADEIALKVRGRRVVVAHSDLTASRHALWVGDTYDAQTEDLTLYDTVLDAVGGQATAQVHDAARVVFFHSQLIHPSRPALEAHGRVEGLFVADSVFVHGGAVLGGQAEDAVSDVRFEHDIFHHDVGALFAPDGRVDGVVAQHNLAYSDLADAFHNGAMGRDWVMRDNQVQPYRAVPEGVRGAGIRPRPEGMRESPEPTDEGTPEPSPEPAPE